MPRTTRTFIAIAVPDDRAARLGHLQTRLAPEVPGARWVDPKQFHATLAFLGENVAGQFDAGTAHPFQFRVKGSVARQLGFHPHAVSESGRQNRQDHDDQHDHDQRDAGFGGLEFD